MVPLAYAPAHDEEESKRSEGCSIQQPYSQWNHPYKTIPDKICSFLARRLLNLDRLAERCEQDDLDAIACSEGDEARKLVRKKRRLHLIKGERNRMMIKFAQSYERSMVRLHEERSWTSLTAHVPRLISVLEQWEIVGQIGFCSDGTHRRGRNDCEPRALVCAHQKETNLGSNCVLCSNCTGSTGCTSNYIIDEDRQVTIILHGPTQILLGPRKVAEEGKDQTQGHNTEEGGCHKGESSSIPSYIKKRFEKHHTLPIIMWFHGGGMMFGSARDNRALDLAWQLLRRQDNYRQQHEKCQQPHPSSSKDVERRGTWFPFRDDLLLITVEMGLAPERPFPNGVIDCLSAAAYVLEHFPASDIHIAGESAGGNYAAVVAMECVRKYPGRIKSAYIMQPILLPMANSVSHYVNGPSSGLCPVSWLRWAWRVYLSLHVDTNDKQNDGELPAGEGPDAWHRLIAERNRAKYKDTAGGGWHRLFSPQIDLPASLKDGVVSPRIIVITSLADPVRDDGVELVTALLEKGANVQHIESTGSHAIGLAMDQAAKETAMESWRAALWR